MLELQFTNRWRLSQYDRLWREASCEIVEVTRIIAQDYLGVIERFPDAFRGRSLTVDDVTTQGLRVVLKKR